MKTSAGVEIRPGGFGFLKVVPVRKKSDKLHPGGSIQVYLDGSDDKLTISVVQIHPPNTVLLQDHNILVLLQMQFIG